MMPSSVKVYEVGPRDGLQNESQSIPTGTKVQLINMLSAAGFQAIEVRWHAVGDGPWERSKMMQ